MDGERSDRTAGRSARDHAYAIAPLIALLLMTIGIAACGGPTNPPTASATGSNAGLKLAGCMRAHGVPTFPDPDKSTPEAITVQASGSPNTLTVDGAQVSTPAFQSAMTYCQKDMANGSVTAARLDRIRKGALAMARCMRVHGVPTFPDPLVSNGAQGLIVTGNLKAAHININAPTFQHAMRICQPLEGLPAPGAK